MFFFDDMATYKGYYKQCRKYPDASYEKDLAKYWQNMFYQNKSITYTKKVRIKRSKPIVALIGISFGVDLYLSSMVWGPVKSNSITI